LVVAGPVGVGLVVAAAVVSIAGAAAPKDEFEWLKEAWGSAVMFGFAGLVVGVVSGAAADAAAPAAGPLVATGLVAGLALAVVNAFARWRAGIRPRVFEWLQTAAEPMALLGLLGGLVAFFEYQVTPWVAVPGGIALVLGSAWGTLITRRQLVSAVVAHRREWLKQMGVLGLFGGGIGGMLGGLDYLGGFSASLSGLASWLSGAAAFFAGFALPALPSVAIAGPVAAVLALLLNPWLLGPLAAGVAGGLLLSLLLGREQFAKARRQWLRKAAKLTALTTGLGGLAGVGILCLTAIVTHQLGFLLGGVALSSVILIALSIW
jgi:hypothetical protein